MCFTHSNLLSNFRWKMQWSLYHVILDYIFFDEIIIYDSDFVQCMCYLWKFLFYSIITSLNRPFKYLDLIDPWDLQDYCDPSHLVHLIPIFLDLFRSFMNWNLTYLVEVIKCQWTVILLVVVHVSLCKQIKCIKINLFVI